jgi:ribonucleotide reductase alpha subunit
MLKTVIKRNGSEEPVDYSKPMRWAKWAGPDLDWGDVCLNALQNCPEEKLSTDEIQKRLIDELVSRNDHACLKMAGRLYMGPLQRKTHGKVIPTVLQQCAKMMAVGQMAAMSYSAEDYAYFNEIICHERDFDYDLTQVLQMSKKYSLRDKANNGKDSLETPQFTFMRMAMALSEYYPVETRRDHVATFYDLFSHNILSAPTPNYNNLGTLHRGLASCCLYTAGDTVDSIAAGKLIAFIMTAMSAGLGEFCETRSLGDPVSNNTVVAIGKIPHYRGLVADCSELTKGGRGGSATAYYTCYDPEASEIVMLQNPLLPHDKAVREIHFAMELNKFIIKRALNNEDVYTFNVKTAPEVQKAFFSGDEAAFEQAYFDHETRVGKAKLKYISARKLLIRLATQFYEVGTNYSADMDEINRHTPFLEPIYQSNLCVAPETLLLTDKGHLEIAPLAGTTVNVWNGQEWSPAPVVKTGEAQKLLTVTTDSGEALDCTEYHKWYVYQENSLLVVEKRTSDLKVGDRLVKFDLPRTIGLESQQPTTEFVCILSVVDTDRVSDTYCVTEPIRHMAVFNGILTGNCTEVVQPTESYERVTDLYLAEDHGRGEVSLCSLAAIVQPAIIKRAKSMGGEFSQDYAKVYGLACEYALRMIDYCIEFAEYKLPHIGFTAKARRNAGVGVIGTATVMAQEKLKYSSMEGIRRIHDLAEDHMYHCIQASMKLGKELGNAPWIHKTKWPAGWTPQKTYNRNFDEVLAPVKRYDWDQVSEELMACGGGRFSALVTHQPTESSSKASGYPKGWYAVAKLYQAKSDADNVIPWCAYDNSILGDQYELAWQVPFDYQAYMYAAIQKHTDQTISADYYKDRSVNLELKTSDLLREIALPAKIGVKTRYYTNSLTVDESGQAHITDVIDNCVGGCKV